MARSQTELMSELWILRDRVTILEHLLTEANILEEGQLDNFEPPEALAAKLRSDSDAFAARIVGAGHRQQYTVEGLKKGAALAVSGLDKEEVD